MEFLRLLNSIVRHNCLNQCCSIRAYVELLKEELGEQQTEAKKFAGIISVSSEKMNAEMNFWKEYEANGFGVSWQSLEEIYVCSKRFLPEIEIISNEAMGEYKIYASNLVPKVLENLVDNSLRHGKATEIRFDCYFSSNQDFVIVFRDNGEGIAREDKEKIFEKGFGRNTGLGLFLTREILNITDIEIKEIGEFGNGVCFEIIVPKDHFK